MMSQKDYLAIAEALAGEYACTAHNPTARQVMTRAIYTVAHSLRTTNPRFDHAWFVTACGIEQR